MTKEILEKSKELFDKMNKYQTNLNTFRNKNMHEDNKKREGFNIGRIIKGWAIERTERGQCGLKTSYEGGGYEFIGYLNLDEEDMQYIKNYLDEKYKRVCKEFEELK